MTEVDHFSYGLVTPVLAYAMSVLGALLGLTCTVRARTAPTTGRKVWFLLLGAWAIGGTGIWVMHFIAMMGFGIPSAEIRYDVPITTASAILAVGAVAVGVCAAGLGQPRLYKIVVGGVFTGLGVAAMHYTGIAAMRLDGNINFDQLLVAASVAIAVVASTVALWFSVTVRRPAALIGSALVMGIAVSGMHYTGMYAMEIHVHGAAGPVTGASVFGLLVPIMVLVVLAVVGLVYALLAAPTPEDAAAAAYLDARWGTGPTAPVQQQPLEPRRPAGLGGGGFGSSAHGSSAHGSSAHGPVSGAPEPTTRRQSIPRTSRRGQ